MDWLSPAGLIGAGLGLVIGWVDYRVVSGLVERRMRETHVSAGLAGPIGLERRLGVLRRLLFVTTVGIFPVLGYWLGRTIGG